MLFIDYSSAFNTIVPSKLITKLRTLGLNTSLCDWILDVLTGRPQVLRVGSNTSATLTTAWQNTTPTPSLSLIPDNNETAYMEVVRELSVWCHDNNLSLNMSKTKELIVDYRK
jgi:hypothetical protein